MNSVFVNRIIRACKLDVSLYEEVEADKSATFQAALVVVLSSLAAGVGALSLGASNFLMAPILSLISWYVWAYVIYFVGVKLFGGQKTKSSHGELLRTIGFSSAPGLLRVFGVDPDEKDLRSKLEFGDRDISDNYLAGSHLLNQQKYAYFYDRFNSVERIDRDKIRNEFYDSIERHYDLSSITGDLFF